MTNSNNTLVKGTAFEKQVLDILRLLPGFSLQEHVRLGGKDIDALCDIEDPIADSISVAFECKDYERPLTREQVTKVLADYQPLLTQRLIDRFCLVTKNGIVANGKNCFDGKTTQQLTYAELLDRLISPGPLIRDMSQQFLFDELDKYYVPTRCYRVSIAWTSENFSLVYNPFIDFALDSGFGDLDWATISWLRYAPDGDSTELPARYTSQDFELALDMRKSGIVFELEPLVVDWVENSDITQALALLGSYGTGKSIFAKRLAYLWAERYRRGETNRIPLLIELRDFGSHQDIRGLITHELVNRHGLKYGSYECFNLLNQQGKFLLILDGFDEMKQGLSKDMLLFNFNELNKLYSLDAKVLLCGRPTVFANEVEQASILTGGNSADFTHSVEYIQINIAPFSETDTFTFLENYTKVKHKKEQKRILELIDDLEQELPRNSDLKALLSRPVHLPMLVAVLPEWNSTIRDLSRTKLYEMFIHKTIAREMLKRKREFQEQYDVKSRRRFASDLAVQMFRLGDSRSIRYSEIPDDLILPYKNQGQSLEAAKRDLITACFLERKPPDILFFGHKSFAEYLVAEKVLLLMKEPDPVTGTLGIRFTPEIISFVLELATKDDWVKVARRPALNVSLVDSALKFLLRVPTQDLPGNITSIKSALNDNRVYAEWQNLFSQIPPMTVFRYVEYLESSVTGRKQCSESCETFLRRLVAYDEDMISIHAFRILAKLHLMLVKDLPNILGIKRYQKWEKLGWLPPDAKY